MVQIGKKWLDAPISIKNNQVHQNTKDELIKTNKPIDTFENIHPNCQNKEQIKISENPPFKNFKKDLFQFNGQLTILKSNISTTEMNLFQEFGININKYISQQNGKFVELPLVETLKLLPYVFTNINETGMKEISDHLTNGYPNLPDQHPMHPEHFSNLAIIFLNSLRRNEKIKIEFKENSSETHFKSINYTNINTWTIGLNEKKHNQSLISFVNNTAPLPTEYLDYTALVNQYRIMASFTEAPRVNKFIDEKITEYNSKNPGKNIRNKEKIFKYVSISLHQNKIFEFNPTKGWDFANGITLEYINSKEYLEKIWEDAKQNFKIEQKNPNRATISPGAFEQEVNFKKAHRKNCKETFGPYFGEVVFLFGPVELSIGTQLLTSLSIGGRLTPKRPNIRTTTPTRRNLNIGMGDGAGYGNIRGKEVPLSQRPTVPQNQQHLNSILNKQLNPAYNSYSSNPWLRNLQDFTNNNPNARLPGNSYAPYYCQRTQLYIENIMAVLNSPHNNIQPGTYYFEVPKGYTFGKIRQTQPGNFRNKDANLLKFQIGNNREIRVEPMLAGNLPTRHTNGFPITIQRPGWIAKENWVNKNFNFHVEKTNPTRVLYKANESQLSLHEKNVMKNIPLQKNLMIYGPHTNFQPFFDAIVTGPYKRGKEQLGKAYQIKLVEGDFNSSNYLRDLTRSSNSKFKALINPTQKGRTDDQYTFDTRAASSIIKNDGYTLVLDFRGNPYNGVGTAESILRNTQLMQYPRNSKLKQNNVTDIYKLGDNKIYPNEIICLTKDGKTITILPSNFSK